MLYLIDDNILKLQLVMFTILNPLNKFYKLLLI